MSGTATIETASRFKEVADPTRNYLDWVAEALTPLSQSRFRKHVDLYALVGALDRATEEGTRLDTLDLDDARTGLLGLEQ